MSHKKQAPRPKRDIYEAYRALGAAWLGVVRTSTRKERRTLLCLADVLRFSERMRGHAKGRLLRKRAAYMLGRLNRETRGRFADLLGMSREMGER